MVVVKSSHQLVLSILQGRKRKEGRCCQQCVHRTAVVTLREGALALCHFDQQTKVKGFFRDCEWAQSHRPLQGTPWQKPAQLRTGTGMNRKGQRTLCCYFTTTEAQPSVGRMLCLGCTSLRNEQAASASMAAAFQSPGQHWTCFLGDRRHLKSQLHTDKRGIAPVCVCVCTHMFIHDVHTGTDLWFLSSSSSFVSTSPAVFPCQPLSHLCLDVTRNVLH